MGKTTGISWCDHTFNPWIGCQRVSPGCEHCYAETLAERWHPERRLWGPLKTSERKLMSDSYWRAPLRWDREARESGVRRRVFCGSMCDVFEEGLGLDAVRARLFALIYSTPWLDWLLLSKRPHRLFTYRDALRQVLDNVWLGTSVESHEYVERALWLFTVPAKRYFVSCEPLLGPLSLRAIVQDRRPVGFRLDVLSGFGPQIDWVIVGGESGPGARPMDLAWAEALQRECADTKTAFFFKQRSGPRSGMVDGVPASLLVQEIPK